MHFYDSFKDFLCKFENDIHRPLCAFQGSSKDVCTFGTDIYRFLVIFRIASKIFCALLTMISIDFCALLG